MSLPWQQMSADEFGAFEQGLDHRVARLGGHYWRQVRPFFFRPLMPFEMIPQAQATPPLAARLGGFQHAVPEGAPANSFLNLLMFENAQAYALETLNYNPRRQTRLAAKQFTVRPVESAQEFKEKAYPVYLSFYERTQYRYKAERREQASFNAWADQLYRNPKMMILGAYRNGELGALSISQWIQETVMYSTFFCNGESLKLYVSDLMMHSVRAGAATCPGVKRVFAGMHKDEKGLNDFYMLRGAHLLRLPARLVINPVTSFLLRRWMAAQFARLSGHIEERPAKAPETARGAAMPGDANHPASGSPAPEPKRLKENLGNG